MEFTTKHNLTHGIVKFVNIGSADGLSPVCQWAIALTNLTYCQLNLKEQTSVKFKYIYKHFLSSKCIRKYCLQNVHHFVWVWMC